MILQKDMTFFSSTERSKFGIFLLREFASLHDFQECIRSPIILNGLKAVHPMFDMFVREYFDNSLIPLSDTIEAFVFRRDNIVQAGNRTATRISRVQFGIRMLLVIQNLVFRNPSKYC